MRKPRPHSRDSVSCSLGDLGKCLVPVQVHVHSYNLFSPQAGRPLCIFPSTLGRSSLWTLGTSLHDSSHSADSDRASRVCQALPWGQRYGRAGQMPSLLALNMQIRGCDSENTACHVTERPEVGKGPLERACAETQVTGTIPPSKEALWGAFWKGAPTGAESP